MARLAITVRGVVQGVGFRPFVHAAATRHGVAGWVRNLGDGLALEVEGDDGAVHAFLATLRSDAPPAARVEGLEVVSVAAPAAGPSNRFGTFAILASAASKVA